MQIEGKVAIITGASEGIGAALAKSFRECGAKLSLVARSHEKLEQVGGDGALITAGDLTDPSVPKAAVDATVARFGRIDILINNAAVGLYAPSWSAPMGEVRRMYELNVFAPLALTQLVVPLMRAQKSGCIVNVSSIAGKVTLPWFTLYSASKHALLAMTEGLRMEVGRDGIHAMAVCPGYVSTAFQKHVLGGAPPAAVQQSNMFRISAEQCAAAIVEGIQREARTVVTPSSGWAFIAASRLLPGFVEDRLARYLHGLGQ